LISRDIIWEYMKEEVGEKVSEKDITKLFIRLGPEATENFHKIYEHYKEETGFNTMTLRQFFEKLFGDIVKGERVY